MIRESHVGGFTLVELAVVLALLGLILGMSALALVSLRDTPRLKTARRLIAARDSAIRTGSPVVVSVRSAEVIQDTRSDSVRLLFLPDGRAVGLGVDPLTGLPRAIQ